MIRRDYHMHTTYCDGSNTAEEMILAAIDMGLEEIGISGHSHTSFDESYCMSVEQTQTYVEELAVLRGKYADRISLRIGLELDRYSDADTSAFDYLVRSAHYIRIPFRRMQGGDTKEPGKWVRIRKSGPKDLRETSPDVGACETNPAINLPHKCLYEEKGDLAFVYIPVDEAPEILMEAADAYFGGDLVELAVAYFDTVGSIAEAVGAWADPKEALPGGSGFVQRTHETADPGEAMPGPGSDIIGHFDLITKFNEGGRLFDENDPRYRAAWQRAVDRLIPCGLPFEINTGAMSKKYRTEPYPARPIRDYIRSHGGRFILSSDSHRTGTICYAFDLYEGEVTEL